MGWTGNGFNSMVIAKVPQAEDQERIFMNASVLNNTEFSISKQLPHEVEERKIFGWPKYKKARQDGRYARFDGGRLMVDNEPVSDIDTVQLPPASSALEGTRSTPVAMGTSSIFDNENHIFQAWAVQAKDLQGVREGLDDELSSGLAAASHVPYAFRFREADGKIVENFDSDADNGMGLRILKTLRANQALNVAVYVGHCDTGGTPLGM